MFKGIATVIGIKFITSAVCLLGFILTGNPFSALTAVIVFLAALFLMFYWICSELQLTRAAIQDTQGKAANENVESSDTAH